MNTSRQRDFAALGVTFQVAGETLCELLAFAAHGTTDLAPGLQVAIRAGLYVACVFLLPRLRRRIPFNPNAEK